MRCGRIERLRVLVPMLVLAACGDHATPKRGDGDSATASDGLARSEPSIVADSTAPVMAALRDSSRAAGDIEIHPASQLAQMATELAGGSTTARKFCGQPTLQCVEARRATSGVPEVHEQWIDVTVVQAGRAVLLSGGRVAGAHLASPGEHRGGTIVGGTPHPLGVGDLLIVPAGVPHQYQVAPRDSVVYLTIKVARASR